MGGENMQEIDIRIQELNKTICENIELIDFTSRGLVSQNILSQARNLVEHVAMKAYGTEHDLTVGYGDIKTSLSFIKTDNKYLFLRKFHEFLQESRSHYGSSHEGAERLILKYYKYLVELKNFVKDEYGLEILQNIDKFPVNTDKTIQEYYEKIADVLKQNRPLVQYNKGERYYVKKIKSFIVDGKVYYENTLTPVADNISKMDRFIAFSKNMIPYILIDEYQDTSTPVIEMMQKLRDYSMAIGHPMLLGYYGDAMQNIYTDGIGDALLNPKNNFEIIDKRLNRRKGRRYHIYKL